MGCFKCTLIVLLSTALIQYILSLQIENLSSSNNEIKHVFELRIPWEFNDTIPSNDYKEINVSAPNGTVFALIQLHSYLYNVSIEDDNGTLINGANTGFIMFPKDVIKFKIINNNRFSIDFIGFITAYDENSPIPGSNLPINDTIDPMIKLYINPNIIKLSIVPSVMVDIVHAKCTNNLRYQILYMYTAEKDYSKNTYFEGIRSIVFQGSHPDDYVGTSVRWMNVSNDLSMTSLFANYPGTGLFFNVIVFCENKSSNYIVSHTYGCDYPNDFDSCIYLESTWQRVCISILGAVGLILSFCGYEWKSFDITIMCLILVGIPVYTLSYGSCSPDENLLISILSGLSVGFVVAICSLYCSRFKYVHHFTSFATFAILCSCFIMFFSGTGYTELFKVTHVYWLSFLAITLTIFILLFINRPLSHYVTSSSIGTLMAVLLVDYFAGSSLKYIIFDNIRRVCVNQFAEATINPPFQTPDVVLFVLWLSSICTSMAFQYYGRVLLFCAVRNEQQSINTYQEPFQNESHSSSQESLVAENDRGYSTFSDTSPLVSPDPKQRCWLSFPGH